MRRPLVAMMAVTAVTLTLVGCGRPQIPPSKAMEIAQAHPEVAAWHQSHTGRLRPVAMVDLVQEGLLVRFESAVGPRPRRVEVTIDKQTGAVLKVKQR